MTNTIYWSEKTTGNTIRVAIQNTCDELTLEKIRAQTNCRVVPEKKSESEIRRLIRSHYSSNPDNILKNIDKQKLALESASSWESEPIINLVDSLLDESLKEKATDIHLEPSRGILRIRLRKDGLLQDYKILPGWIAEPVLIRLKLLANVDITERRIPHDGSFSYQGLSTQANIRLSTLPTQDGEKCVLRLLPATDEGETLESLMFSSPILKALRETFVKPQGLFLITGPTGSGKTTTLYAGLREILCRKINVTTIEDPVEYRLYGANQVQVNEKCGFTFAKALRSILRQDPDVILVGEIRDEETAQIATRAAQTGHLVIATLHTNSAKAATGRLMDLGVSRKTLDESLLGVVAQRLLRKKTLDGYHGRIVAIEFLRPDGTYVDGTLQEYAKRLVENGCTDQTELDRVIGA